jgi:hypothetical protein
MSSLAIGLVWVIWGGIGLYRDHKTCKHRATDFAARMENIRQLARHELSATSSHDDIDAFYTKIDMPNPEYSEDERSVSNVIRTVGCGPSFACGDSVLLRVSMKLNSKGGVEGTDVDAMYDDCL